VDDLEAGEQLRLPGLAVASSAACGLDEPFSAFCMFGPKSA